MKQTPADLPETRYELHIIRTARLKTARIRVEDGVVSITVPMALPDQQIELLLSGKRQWIKEKLMLQTATPSVRRDMHSGEAFPYLGRNYRLKLATGERAAVKLKRGQLMLSLPAPMHTEQIVREELVAWYRQQALLRRREKVNRFAAIIGVQPANLRIKAFKSRWGNCNVKGEIELNWKIIMAPHSVVNYVVVHELCHLKHPDHSPSYWNAVQNVIPDYLECQSWLKDVGNKFEF